MLNLFLDYIRQQHLFPTGQEVLLAVSGGRDSVCMAHLFHRARIPFAIAHCNFHLRPADCDRDQAFVRRLAADFGVTFHTVDFDTRAFAASHSMSIEEAARHLRYSWFAGICADHGYGSLATAHHRDDSVETFFLNLFRGTGLAGLHGILPTTHYQPPTTNYRLAIVRPLLCFSRADIDRYIDENHLAYVEDSTNAELDARRNRIRLQLMPLLRELYNAVDSTMEANISRLFDAELILDAYVTSLRTALVQNVAVRVPAPALSIQAIRLEALEDTIAPFHYRPSTQRTLLFELLRPYGFNAAQTAEMLAAARVPRTGSRWFSPTHTAAVDRDRLLLAPVAEPVAPRICCRTVASVDTAAPGLGRSTVFVDADLVAGWSLRRWQAADRFCPFGMGGRQRLVSDVLKDMKLSVVEKEHVYVLCAADGRIVWLVGLRADHRFRVGPNTKNVLELEAFFS